MTSELAGLWERWRVPVFLLTIVALIAGSQFDGLGSVEGVLTLLAVPLVASLGAFAALRNETGRLKVAAIAVAALVALVSELEVREALFPGPALASVKLSPTHADATVQIPDGAGRVEIETNALLAADASHAQGKVSLDVERAGQHAQVNSAFSKSAGRRRVGRSSVGGGSIHAEEVARSEVEIPASGPLRLHLNALSGSLLPPIEVAVRTVSPLTHFFVVLLGLGAAGAFAVQWLASRRGVRTFYAAGIGIALAAATYTRHAYDPHRPFAAMIATMVVAMVAGGGSGLFLAALADRFARKPSS